MHKEFFEQAKMAEKKEYLKFSKGTALKRKVE